MAICLTNINGLYLLLKQTFYSSLCPVQCFAKISHSLNTLTELNWTNATLLQCDSYNTVVKAPVLQLTSFVALGSLPWALLPSFLVWGREGSGVGVTNSRVYSAQAGDVTEWRNWKFCAQWEGLSIAQLQLISDMQEHGPGLTRLFNLSIFKCWQLIKHFLKYCATWSHVCGLIGVRSLQLVQINVDIQLI